MLFARESVHPDAGRRSRGRRGVLVVAVTLALLTATGCQSPWGWGRNHVGQLGDGTQFNRLSPWDLDPGGSASPPVNSTPPPCARTAPSGDGATTAAGSSGRATSSTGSPRCESGTRRRGRPSAPDGATPSRCALTARCGLGAPTAGATRSRRHHAAQLRTAGRHRDVELRGRRLRTHDRCADGRHAVGLGAQPLRPDRQRHDHEPAHPPADRDGDELEDRGRRLRAHRRHTHRWDDVELGSQPRRAARRRHNHRPPTPGQVGTATTWATVDAAFGHTVAIRTDGTLWAWGLNDDGELGDGTNTTRTAPVQIGSATTWRKVAVSDEHTLATRTNGTLWAWGANGGGQLGDGTTTGRTAPAQVGTSASWSDSRPAASAPRPSAWPPRPTRACGCGARAIWVTVRPALG